MVRVQVYSLNGRLVRTLVDENRSAGPFYVRWNGTTDTGVRAASGTYFVRLVNGAEQDTRPILLLKIKLAQLFAKRANSLFSVFYRKCGRQYKFNTYTFYRVIYYSSFYALLDLVK